MANEAKVDTIAEELRKRILAKEYGTAGRLPPIRMLAEQFQVSRELMDKSLLRLQAEGLLVSYGTAGVFVNLPQARISGVNPSFGLDLGQVDLPLIRVNIEEPAIIAASEEVAEMLRVKEGVPVVRRFLRQGTERTTYRVAEEFYPAELFGAYLPYMSNPDFDVLAESYEHLGRQIEEVQDDLIARLPTLREQGWFNVVRNTPIIEVKRVGYFDMQEPMVFSRILFLANLVRFSYRYRTTHDKQK